MIKIRNANDRGHANHGWLDTYYTFSFSRYFDPEHMGFRSLRVMNEDEIAPGKGFGTHGHENMEIVTYVLSGALEHKDSMGHGEVLKPGEFQRISAGSGITHSEFNPSETEPTHLYQIWLEPNVQNVEPSYEQKSFPAGDNLGQFRLVASPDGEDGSLRIHQNSRVYLATLDPGQQLTQELPAGRHAWLQVLRGEASLNGHGLSTSDGAAISGEESLSISATSSDGSETELMLFDLP